MSVSVCTCVLAYFLSLLTDICVSSMDLFDDDPVDFSISDNAETQKGSNELVQESSSSTVPTTTNPPVDQSIM